MVDRTAPVVTRAMATADQPAVGRLLDVSLGEGFWDLDLNRPGSHRVASRKDDVVGVVSAVLVKEIGVSAQLEGPIGLVRLAAVDPSARRAGIATRLISEVCDECAQQGARSFAAFAWVHADTGIALLAGALESLGFRFDRRMEHFFAEAAGAPCPQCACAPCICAADLYVAHVVR